MNKDPGIKAVKRKLDLQKLRFGVRHLG